MKPKKPSFLDKTDKESICCDLKRLHKVFPVSVDLLKRVWTSLDELSSERYVLMFDQNILTEA